MKALARRVGRVEARDWAREGERGPSHLIVMPESWPEEARLAYDALAGGVDFAAWASLQEQHAGQRPGPRTRVIALRLRAGGPQ